MHSLVRQFFFSAQYTPKMMGFLGIGNNPMVGATVAFGHLLLPSLHTQINLCLLVGV
ncbi:MAG: hypothetical protein E7089_08595 [Bacteroidales bacterium]|nr:hypothetical protein [Bacteroidales bacterium]